MSYIGTYANGNFSTKSNVYTMEQTRWTTMSYNTDQESYPPLSSDYGICVNPGFLKLKFTNPSDKLNVAIDRVQIEGVKYDADTKRFYYRTPTAAGKYILDLSYIDYTNELVHTTETFNFTPGEDGYVLTTTIMGKIGIQSLPSLTYTFGEAELFCKLRLEYIQIASAPDSWIFNDHIVPISEFGMIPIKLGTHANDKVILEIINDHEKYRSEIIPNGDLIGIANLTTNGSAHRNHEFEISFSPFTPTETSANYKAYRIYQADVSIGIYEKDPPSTFINQTPTTFKSQNFMIYFKTLIYGILHKQTDGTYIESKRTMYNIPVLIHTAQELEFTGYVVNNSYVIELINDVIAVDVGTQISDYEYMPTHSGHIRPYFGYTLFSGLSIKFCKGFKCGFWRGDTGSGINLHLENSNIITDIDIKESPTLTEVLKVYIKDLRYSGFDFNIIDKDNVSMAALASGFAAYNTFDNSVLLQQPVLVSSKDILVSIMKKDGNSQNITISELYDMIQRQKVNDLEQRLHALEVACADIERSRKANENEIEYDDLMEIKQKYSSV